MSAVIEIKFFNSFLLKKTNSTNGVNAPAYDGSKGIPQDIGGYPSISYQSGGYDDASSWVIEEARITGGYNNTNVDYGVKAYIVEEETNGFIRGSSLIYSGIFNSRTGVNNTNQFPVGEEITRSLDPSNGSIQKLYAENSNLTILQENKVSKALIDKDAIYSAEGGAITTSGSKVIGQVVPYAGEYGISKNPDSFAVYGYRKYFTDKTQNVVLRLSQDGITELSSYGMRDYFRDRFNNMDDAQGSGRVIGGWDIHNSQYVVSTTTNINSTDNSYETLSFDESVRGWTSFFTYDPDIMFSLRNNFYSLKDNKLYFHYSNSVNRGNFYGKDNNTSITFLFNPNVSLVKNFNTVSYEGSNGFQVTSFASGFTGEDEFNSTYSQIQDTSNVVRSYESGEYVINPANGQAVIRADYQTTFGTTNPALNRYHAGFDRKENKYVAYLVNNSTATQGEVRFGSQLTGIKGFFATVTISTDMVIDANTNQATSGTNIGGLKELFAVSSNYVQSSY